MIAVTSHLAMSPLQTGDARCRAKALKRHKPLLLGIEEAMWQYGVKEDLRWLSVALCSQMHLEDSIIRVDRTHDELVTQDII